MLATLAFALTCDPFGKGGLLPENRIIDRYPVRSVMPDETEALKPRQMPTYGAGFHAEPGGQLADRNLGIVQRVPYPRRDLPEAPPPPYILAEVYVRKCYHTVLRPPGR